MAACLYNHLFIQSIILEHIGFFLLILIYYICGPWCFMQRIMSINKLVF